MNCTAKAVITCDVIILLVIGLELANGAFFLVVKNEGLFKPPSILDSYIATYFAPACISLAFTVVNIVLTARPKRTYCKANASYALTLFVFCLQGAVAVISGALITVLDRGLSQNTRTLPDYVYTWIYLIKAQTIVSFALAIPCLIILMQLRWS